MVGRTSVLAALGYVVCGLGACAPVEIPAADDVTDAEVTAPRDEAARDGGDDAAVIVDAIDAVVTEDVTVTPDVEVTLDAEVTVDALDASAMPDALDAAAMPDALEDVPVACEESGVCPTHVLRPRPDGCVVESVRIPETGTWRFTAVGGSGGGGAPATRIQGDFGLVAGTELRVIVARAGVGFGSAASGGGGSYVVQGTRPLVVAGGGGGNGNFGSDGLMGRAALIGNNGTVGVDGPSTSGPGAGGRGLGFGSRSFSAGERCVDLGGSPGWGDPYWPGYTGTGGGGGAGFEGGSGGATGPDRFHWRGDGGGGGTSFNSGVNQAASHAPEGDGYVTLTPVSPTLCATGGVWCGERCVDTTLAVDHCGACGRACVLPHAVPRCERGACAVMLCTDGFADCDGVAANGCESARDTVDHCGTCRRACAPDHATGVCVAGGCAIGVCAAGYTDCDLDPANGCEQVGACTTITYRPTHPSCLVQTFTAPAAGVYRITATGAAHYGSGARLRGDFTLAAGTVLSIVVGESSTRGADWHHDRGSGGTFVVQGATPLLVAGGDGEPDIQVFSGEATAMTGGEDGFQAPGMLGLGGAGGRDGADGRPGAADGDAGGGLGGQGFASRVFVPGGACESFGGAAGAPPRDILTIFTPFYAGRGGGGGYSGGGGGGAGRSRYGGGRGGGGGSFNAGAHPEVLPPTSSIASDGSVEITPL